MPGQYNSAGQERAVLLLNGVNIVGSGSGTGVEVVDYEGHLTFLLIAGSAAGSGLLSSITIETSDVLGSGYVTAKQGNNVVAGYAVLDTAGDPATWVQKLVIPKDHLKRYVRATYSFVGTNIPTWVIMLGTRKQT